MKKFSGIVLVLAIALAACSSGADSSSKELEASQDRVAELEAEASTTSTTSTPASTAVPITAAPETVPVPTAPPATAAPVLNNAMPNVVCMDLQSAQDHIQATTGVFLSLSEDASGEDRSQVIDSNWIVVAQRPAPGTPIDEGDAVLSVVKIDEPNIC